MLKDVAGHPNSTYFILKSIIVRNLYGVDIMEEAVEICKLRLFLKLVSHVDNVRQLEPLPDIDFNIRPGNTLVGFATLADVNRTILGKLADNELKAQVNRIVEEAEIVDRAFQKFHEMQTVHGMNAREFAAQKQELRSRLDCLSDELDRHLAGEYGVDPDKPKEFEKWQKSHQPFHWFAEFFGIMRRGGFDVIIGNPPYRELRAVTEYSLRGYSTTTTRNLYPLLLERAFPISRDSGRLGFIVPVSSISTEGYRALQDIVFRYPGHFSSFDDRPSRLFDGLEHIQLTIHLLHNSHSVALDHHTTECNRWSAAERDTLFSTLEYELVNEVFLQHSLPKVSRPLEHALLRKIWADKLSLGEQVDSSGDAIVYYSRKVHNFFQVLDFVPEVYDGRGKLRPPTELKELRFSSAAKSDAVFCLLNSTLFRWFVNVFSDCRHINKREVEQFRCDAGAAIRENGRSWQQMARRLSKRLLETSEFREMRFSHDTLRVQCIIPKHSKSIIDEIDQLLAQHYGFTDEELDFIINYDIKYRMGQDNEEDE